MSTTLKIDPVLPDCHSRPRLSVHPVYGNPAIHRFRNMHLKQSFVENPLNLPVVIL
jgi:hypothetical protein